MHEWLRNLGRRALPRRAADRARSYERRLRAGRGIPAVARRVEKEAGSVVLSGPFAGMRLLPGFENDSASPVLKLAGVYESVLHGAIEEAIQRRPRLVVNVGCAEGYYAVGLARRLPYAVVNAYDLSRDARTLAARAARLNDVADRIVIRGRCRHVPPAADFVICDIEGAEQELLSPIILEHTFIIVETHEFAVPGVCEYLTSVFSGTHEVERVTPRKPCLPEPIAGLLREDELRLALDEMRTGEQHWLVMQPNRLS